MTAAKEELRRQMLAAYDLNHDGKISPEKSQTLHLDMAREYLLFLAENQPTAAQQGQQHAPQAASAPAEGQTP